jgi:phage repressor protein C with HTH and peptisase S24 domain
MDAVWHKVNDELARRGKPWRWLAGKLDESEQTVNNWKRRGIPPRQHGPIATALDWSIDRLLDREDVPPQAEEAATRSDPVPPALRNVRTVWVIGSTQGGLPERIWSDGDHPVGSSNDYTLTATTDQHAFACKVVGESMVPRYMPGEYALVEPDTAPELEDDVLVRLASGETMLKRLLSRRGGVRLGSYNSSEVLSFLENEITWMYYVAHPIPARRIKHRVDSDDYHGEERRHPDEDEPSNVAQLDTEQSGGMRQISSPWSNKSHPARRTTDEEGTGT